ncbi:hypothetical protein [Leifsonia sp. NPDC077715]|uniref:hypothetical protein n=1 Tax=Leifsonia sp. NPDC077715 TaxID=3155539 RepID=UPI003426E46F
MCAGSSWTTPATWTSSQPPRRAPRSSSACTRTTPSRRSATRRRSASAVVASGRIAGILGERVELLDLGEALSGPMAGPSAHVAALGRSIRGLVAPATSRMTVIASAGRSVTTDAITIVSGTAERYADAATASEYIDAGAEVLMLRRRRRILRPARARSTWSPAG